MIYSKTKIRFLSLFVLAFLCLNAGGFVCLAYCGQSLRAKADHCPLQRSKSHCPHSKAPAETTNDRAITAGSISCCIMPVSMIGAPLEAIGRVDLAVVAVEAVRVAAVETPVAVYSRLIPKYYYRPPPNDKRPDRIRNQVFRI